LSQEIVCFRWLNFPIVPPSCAIHALYVRLVSDRLVLRCYNSSSFQDRNCWCCGFMCIARMTRSLTQAYLPQRQILIVYRGLVSTDYRIFGASNLTKGSAVLLISRDNEFASRWVDMAVMGAYKAPLLSSRSACFLNIPTRVVC
jgi:hypothetical protein